jgi:hypothetical protein
MKIVGAKFQIMFSEESLSKQGTLFSAIKVLCETEGIHCWRSISEKETLIVNISNDKPSDPDGSVKQLESIFAKIRAILVDQQPEPYDFDTRKDSTEAGTHLEL